jgi:hypothetical protein
MRQKVEIEVDPAPAGYRYTGEYRRVAPGEHYAYEGESHKCYGERGCYLILEKLEPKRESRWANLYQHRSGMLCRSRDECTDALSGERVSIIRIDYEDGKPVAVTLEPEGEP